MKTRIEFVRFCLVSMMVGTTDLGVYFLAKNILPIDVSKGLSFVCAGILGYFFNKHWTFDRHHRSNSEMVRYGATEFFLLGFNISVNRGLLLLLPEAHFLAAATASLSTALVSFVCKKMWVFKTA